MHNRGQPALISRTTSLRATAAAAFYSAARLGDHIRDVDTPALMVDLDGEAMA